MSALFGLFQFDGGSVDPTELAAMGEAQAVHGPDLAGRWAQEHVGLGVRVMRFTPEDVFERQPLVSADGRRVLVFDGRVDNRPELASQLGISAVEARGLGDSAFVLRAYQAWGADCAARLIGDFVWALWDAHEDRLLLARSPFSSRSVVFHVSPRRLAFASRPKGLFALASVARAIDPAQLIDYLLVMPPDADRTFFKDLRRLAAGHTLNVNRSGSSTHPYWTIDNVRGDLRFARDEEYVEAFSAIFERVIADQSRSRTPLGVMMSGGLDSTSIAVSAAGQARARAASITAFTEVPRAGYDGPMPPGRYADETNLVRAVVAGCDNLESVIVRTDGRTYLEGLDTFLHAAESPFPAASNRVWHEEIVRQSNERGLRVLLSGGGGNLTISWMGQSRLPEMLAGRQLRRAWLEAHQQRRARGSTLRALLAQGVVPLLPDALWRGLRRLRSPGDSLFKSKIAWRAYSPIDPQFATAEGAFERMRAKGFDPHFRPPNDTRRARLDTLIATRDLGADIVAGYEALYGVQVRAPAVDVRLIEFCLGVPEEQCLRDGQSRWLIRRAMRDRLPPAVLANERRGLQAADWLERLQGAADRVSIELDRIAGSDLASRALDIPRLRKLAGNLSNAGGPPERVLTDYRGVLDGGLMTGAFLRWFESIGGVHADPQPRVG